jgi:citrate synthase
MSELTKVWWKKEPLSVQEAALLDAVLLAHHHSCYRNNPSTAAVIQAAYGSGDLGNAICSGILSTGGKHAPIINTCFFLLLEQPHQEVLGILKSGNKVPGWGGNFQKENQDPIWDDVRNSLSEGWPKMSAKLEAVTSALHDQGKNIYPNPSAYTAAAAIVLGLGPRFAQYFFILGRLSAWSQIAAHNMQQKKE